MQDQRPARTRANTRERLIDAGRALFYTRDYPAISVQAIADEAELTRAAFYLHFNSKDDLLAAMMMAESHRNDRLFRWFEGEPPSRASIERFLRRLLRGNANSSAVRLFHLAALQSEAAREAFQANRLRLMALLGEGFPAFRPPRDDSPEETRRLGEAILAAFQYEQLSLREAEIADPALVEQMLQAVVEHLCALHARYPSG